MDLSQIINNKAFLEGQKMRAQQRLENRDLESLAAGKTPEEQRAALKKASKAFEAVFVYQMIAAMRKTVGDGGLIEKSNGEEIFEGMLDEEWAKKLTTQTGSKGLAQTIYQQLGRQLGVETGTLPEKDERGFMKLTSPNSRALPLNERAFVPLERRIGQPLPLRPEERPTHD